MGDYTSDRRLFLNADKSRVVDEDDPEASYLLVGEGGTVPAAEAERLGLHGKSGGHAAEHGDAAGDGVQHEPHGAAAGDAEPKGRRAAEDKAVKGPAEDK